MQRREALTTILATVCAATTAIVGGAMPFAEAVAQERYPSRPVTLIVPFAAGGLNDATARLWAENVKGPLGGTLVIDNRGGAGGTIGAAEVARAKPDGYTLLLGSSTTQVMNPAVMPKVPYDPLKDFTAVSIFAVATATIAVHPSVPAKSLTELAAYIRANPGKESYGSAGTGTNSHLAGEMFKHLAGGLDMVHIPYKGGGAAVSDLIAGHIKVASPHMTAQVLELHNTGKIRVLAVASPKRLQGAPDLPTSAESGLPGLVATTFNGIFAPANTPADIITRIDAATQAAMKNREFLDALVKGGFDPVTGVGGEAAQRYVAEEVNRLTPVIKATRFMQK
ncbi:MAG: Bug family tripartite tricarboxylate transporter substrate binding protein [Xanthobacteraceae bacterium]